MYSNKWETYYVKIMVLLLLDAGGKQQINWLIGNLMYSNKRETYYVKIMVLLS